MASRKDVRGDRPNVPLGLFYFATCHRSGMQLFIDIVICHLYWVRSSEFDSVAVRLFERLVQLPAAGCATTHASARRQFVTRVQP